MHFLEIQSLCIKENYLRVLLFQLNFNYGLCRDSVGMSWDDKRV